MACSMLLKALTLAALISCVHLKKKVEPTYSYQNGNSQMFVFDNVFHPRMIELMRSMIMRNRTFSYYYPDPYENDTSRTKDGGLHWSGPISPHTLIKTRFWAGVRQIYQALPEEFVQGKRYLPYVAHGTMLRRGDYTTPFRADPSRKDSIFLRIWMTRDMKKNIYSDQTFYDENDEIVTSIHPKLGRVVAWTGDILTLFKPPGMEFEQAEISFLLKLTPDKDLFLKACQEHADHDEKVEKHAKIPFPFTNQKSGIEEMDVSKNLLGKYYDKQGNMVAFFDNIIPKEQLDQLRSYVTHYEKGFGYNAYDPASSETHDNVNWIIQYKIEKVLNTPYWEAVRALSKYMSNTTEWYPYDVSTNLLQHTHHTRIHLDCTFQEYEYTFLLYLNPNWDENNYGETIFVDYAPFLDPKQKRKDPGGEANEWYDFVAAAIPKYGRIAIFRNLIPHSARPPAPNFLAARYTFPVKVSETFRMARAKMLMEALDYKPEGAKADPWYEQLSAGQYDEYLTDERREWVEKHLKKMNGYKDQSAAEGIKQLEETLIPTKFRNPPKVEL